jgi:hypothetical protein
MNIQRVTLTHPKIPRSEFIAFAHQVEMWAKRGWQAVTGESPDPTTPAPDAPAPKTPAALAPADTPKEG